MLVISQAEGVRIGALTGAYLDPEARALIALTCRRDRSHFQIGMHAVAVLGQDVVVIGERGDARELGDGHELGGRELRTYVGIPVTTQGGERVGRIEDARFDSASGKLSTLLLHDGRALDVDPEQVTLGRDEVLVPEEYARRIRNLRPREVGLLARMAPMDVRDVVTGVVRRITGRPPRLRGAAHEPAPRATGTGS
jgi:sporulation protein YlmC with PRC-barrel domain